ncbi:protein-glutamine glutaminase family protein, partial [Amycolatopsis thailandensis]|uniref:protein-glutamine glutaminase family protein n=1 Tax=Amycolatopsis thailandensis TaxID=589330 RepID=UPI00362C863D
AYALRIGEQLLGRVELDFRELLDLIRFSGASRREAALGQRFGMIHEMDLISAIHLARDQGRLPLAEAYRLLERLGAVPEDELLSGDEDLSAPSVWTDVPEFPRNQPQIRSFAGVLKEWIESGLEDDALTLLGRLDRRPRVLRAVQGAYDRLTAGGAFEGRDLFEDLVDTLPAERVYLEHLFARPSVELASWQDGAVPTVVEWDTAVEWMRELGALMLDLRDSSISVPHEYSEEGCGFRGHLAAMKLIQLGASPRKMIVSSSLSQLKIVRTDFAGNEYDVRWAYHTAPIVYVRGPAGPEWMVFDCSLAPWPLRREEWLSKMEVDMVAMDLEGSEEAIHSAMEAFSLEPAIWGPDDLFWGPLVMVTDLHTNFYSVFRNKASRIIDLDMFDDRARANEGVLVVHAGIVEARKLAGRIWDKVSERMIAEMEEGIRVGEDDLFDLIYSMIAGGASDLSPLREQVGFMDFLRLVLPTRFAELDSVIT